MEEKKLVPRRRFVGFTDEWRKRELGDVADIIGGGTPSTSNERYWGGEVDWYSPVEIVDQTFVSSSQKKITELGLQKSSAKILPIGTVLFTSRAGIGNTAILAKVGATNQGFQSIVPYKDKLDSYFIYSKTNELRRYGEKNGAGSTFIEVSGKQMSKMPIVIPSLEEQIKLGNFFKRLDENISFQQRKLEKTKALKSAYLAEMFPAVGERVPKRRFSGHTKEWKVNKLSSVADVRDGTHDSPKYHSQGHPLVTSKNVKNGFINYEDIQYISDADFENINKRSKVDKNDILMGMIGTIGNIALVRETPDFAIKNVALIKDTDSIYYLYLYYCLQSPLISTQLVEGLDGGTQKFISLNKIRNLIVTLPEEEEQIKIGNFLERFDQILALHQQKLDKLKEMKQAYLHEMFV